MRVQITVVVTDNDQPGGVARVESTKLLLSRHSDPGPEWLVANAARLVAEKAMYGRLLATPRKEGGRG